MRVNAHISSAGDFPAQVDKVSPKSVRGGFQLSPKLPGQTPPRTFSHLKDDSTATVPLMSCPRPGAFDHLQRTSRGF